jgi:putative selenium metabolism protein SsnA
MRILSAPIIFTNDDTNTVYQPGAVVVDKGLVSDVGPASEIKAKYRDVQSEEFASGIITPGLVNLHHHLYSSFARGWNTNRSPRNFPAILHDIWWRLDEALCLDDIYYSALVGLCDSVRCGVTSVVDHHSSQKTIAGSLGKIADAFGVVGLRGSVCFELSDRCGEKAFADGLRETTAALESWPRGGDRLSAMIGAHASMTLSDSSLAKIAEIIRKYSAGCHFHLAEDMSDQVDSLAKYGRRVTRRFAEFGLPGEKTLVIHGVHLDSNEIELLGTTKTNLAICPRSNQNNAVGAARWWDYNDVKIGFGTDGIGSDIINEAKSALYITRHESGNPSAYFPQVCDMFLKSNPKIFEKISGIKTGRIAQGLPADLVLWDYDPPTPVNSENIGGHFLYGLSNSQVDTVWVGGEKILEKRRFVKFDYAETIARARELASRLWARL